MFKYTANPDTVAKLEQINKNSENPCNDSYFFAVRITRTAAAYVACGDFWKHYLKCRFYSATKRKEIPVNGILISAGWFVETKV